MTILGCSDMRRTVIGAAVAAVVALASACTGKPDPTPPVTSTSSSAASPSPSPTEVPIDQVPPGRPGSWVPKGVPTTAPYAEPGDVVPKFTLPMFTDEIAGAQAAALYYVHARNWEYAVGDAAPFLAICDAKKCADDTADIAAHKRAGQHVVGGRVTLSALQIAAQPSGGVGDYVARVKVSIAAGRRVDAAGKILVQQPAKSQSWDLYLKWSGKMWRVTGDFLSS
jgi:hypothetical protein